MSLLLSVGAQRIYSCDTPPVGNKLYNQVGYIDANGNAVNDGWIYAVYQDGANYNLYQISSTSGATPSQCAGGTPAASTGSTSTGATTSTAPATTPAGQAGSVANIVVTWLGQQSFGLPNYVLVGGGVAAILLLSKHHR